MAERPVTYRNYYGRWWSAFGHDLFRLGREQVIGALLAVAILILQLHYGIIPASSAHLAWASIFWPYAVLTVGLIAISAARAPVSIDKVRAESIDALEAESAKFQKEAATQVERIKGVSQELVEARKPRLDPAEISIRTEVEGILGALTPQDRSVMKQAVIHGFRIVAGEPLKAIATKLQMDSSVLIGILNKLQMSPLLTFINEPGPSITKLSCS